MSADLPQVRDAAARAIHRSTGGACGWGRVGRECDLCDCGGSEAHWARVEATAAMSVIVPAVTQQVRALHRRIANSAPREGAVYWLCGECRDFWPCDTVRKLDELDAAVRG